MMSKNSFLVSIANNFKRRLVPLVICTIACLYYYCASTALQLSYCSTEDFAGLIRDKLMLQTFMNHIRSELFGYFVLFLAVICAFQGFGYMFSKRKLDMNMSVPVDKLHRFFAIYLNGILCFAIPCALSMMCSFVIASGMGVRTGGAAGFAISVYIMNLLGFINVYNITILAVMLTGNIIACGLGILMLHFYDLLAVGIYQGMASCFLKNWSYYSVVDSAGFMPVAYYTYWSQKAYTSSSWGSYMLNSGKYMSGLAYMLVFAVISLAVVCLFYVNKRAESCNRSMAFEWTKPVIKVMAVSLVALGTANMVYESSGRIMMAAVIGMAITLVLMHGIVEVIYSFDIRSVLRGWKSLAVSAVLSAGILLIFTNDIVGYDKYVPNPDRVQYASVIMEDVYDSFILENGSIVGSDVYLRDNMKLDPVKVCALAECLVSQQLEEGRGITIKYTMKHGGSFYRRYTVNPRENMNEWDAVFSSEEYKTASSPLFTPGYSDHMPMLHAYYDIGGRSICLDTLDKTALIEAYKSDYLALDYKTCIGDIPLGMLRIYGELGESYYSENIPIYSGFANTLKVMSQAEYYTDCPLDPDEIDKIYITNMNEETVRPLQEAGETIDYDKYNISYETSDREEIRQIIPALVSSAVTQGWNDGELYDYSYSVAVFFRNAEDGYSYGPYGVDYTVLKGKLPDFVIEKTTYAGE